MGGPTRRGADPEGSGGRTRLRVIAGEARRIILEAPPRDGTRPLPDRLKESLFSLIGGRVRDAAVLDLYAGSGGFGIEALSRGAARCIFVERDPGAARVIRANLDRTGLAGRADVWRMDAAAALRSLSGRARWKGTDPPMESDLVFLDPPFDEAFRTAAFGPDLARIAGGLVILRTRSDETPDLAPLVLEERRIFGLSLVSFFRRLDPAPS